MSQDKIYIVHFSLINFKDVYFNFYCDFACVCLLLSLWNLVLLCVLTLNLKGSHLFTEIRYLLVRGNEESCCQKKSCRGGDAGTYLYFSDRMTGISPLPLSR